MSCDHILGYDYNVDCAEDVYSLSDWRSMGDCKLDVCFKYCPLCGGLLPDMKKIIEGL